MHILTAECEVIKNYAFVHVDVDDNGDSILQNLNGRNLKGRLDQL